MVKQFCKGSLIVIKKAAGTPGLGVTAEVMCVTAAAYHLRFLPGASEVSMSRGQAHLEYSLQTDGIPVGRSASHAPDEPAAGKAMLQTVYSIGDGHGG